MDPATIAMAAQAINLIAQTLQQYSAGTLTADQAQAVFKVAAQGAQDAMDSFDKS